MTAADADLFGWLELDSPRTAEWEARQAALARAELDALPDRDLVHEWAVALHSADWRSAPTARPTGLFHLQHRGGTPFPVLACERPDGTVEILVDPAEYGPASASYLTAWSVCPRGRLLAFQVCQDGREVGDLRLLDQAVEEPARVIATGVRRPSIAWSTPDGGDADAIVIGGVFHEAAESRSRVLLTALDGTPRREMWTPPEADSPMFPTLAASADGRWLLANCRPGADPSNEVWLLPLGTDVDGPGLRVAARGSRPTLARFGPDDRVYLARNETDRPAVYRLDPGTAEWHPIATLPTGTSLTSFAVGPTAIAVSAAGPRGDTVFTVATDANGQQAQAVSSGIGRIDALTADPVRDRFWWNLLSHTQPRSVHTIDLSEGPAETSVWFAPPTAALVPPTTCSLLSYPSKDGTEVDLTVFGREDLSGPAPVLLTAYGGFGLTLTPAFRADLIVWLAAGGRLAIAHIRGGRDKGPAWHEAARGRTKVRAVEDFEAAAQYLAATGLARPDGIVALGGSNGGMIVASACARRPELFGGAVAVAPVTDLVRYPDIGGDGPSWTAEYGDPGDPEDLAAILSYSPLHNVRDGVAFPRILISVGSGDQRVPPAHGRKLCAAIQAASAADRSAFYRDQHGAGHGVRSQQSSFAALVDYAVFLAGAAGLDLSKAGPAPSPVDA